MSTPKGEIFKESFAGRIRQLVGDASVSEFARKVGLQQASIDRYVKGLREPNADALRQISVACGVSADWLLGVTASPNGVSAADWRSRALAAERKLKHVNEMLDMLSGVTTKLKEAVQ